MVLQILFFLATLSCVSFLSVCEYHTLLLAYLCGGSFQSLLSPLFNCGLKYLPIPQGQGIWHGTNQDPQLFFKPGILNLLLLA